MRHRVAKKHFNRDTNHRKALLRNLVRSLIEQGEIVTTVAKAKETRRISDKLISKAKDDSLNTRRTLHRFFGKRDVVNTLVDKIAPATGKRISGFSRIVKVGKRRGDNAELAKLILVDKPENVGSLRNPAKLVEKTKTKSKAKTTAKSAKAKTGSNRKAIKAKKAAKSVTVAKATADKAIKVSNKSAKSAMGGGMKVVKSRGDK